MPGTSTSGSTNIALLDSKIVADLCAGKFYVDASPSIYIGDGADNVLGANVRITNPYGIVVKDYGDDYEIAPDLSGGMDAIIAFNIPTTAGNYQYGKYKVDIQLFDGENSWTVTKYVAICEPDSKNKTRNYGTLSARLDASCLDGKLYVIVDNVPNYKGKIVESQVLAGTLDYPTASGEDQLDFETGNFTVVLYEGVYKVVATICATYNFGDNVYVKVNYKIKREKNVRCLIDECCVFAKLSELHLKISTDCTDAEKEETASITVDALRLLKTAQLAANCGEDASEYIADLEALLGCKCTCNCAEGTPIINTAPARDFIINGCNVSKETSGLTDTYTIENYEYEVEIEPNGGALIVSTATLANCTKTQVITFDIAVVYSQIKTLANQNNTEGDFWASVVNKALRDVDPNCLDLTQEAWTALTLPAKFTAILTKFCNCCGTCDATIINPSATKVGGDIVLTWKMNAFVALVYLDGQLVGTYLASAQDPTSSVLTHIFSGAADGLEHTWIIEAYCENKTRGEVETDTFQEFGCPTVAPTLLNTSLSEGAISGGMVTGVSCPFDLSDLVSISNTETVEWHTAPNTLAATLVSNPAKFEGGVVYVYNKDSDGCFSTYQKIVVSCDATASCTAPQNLGATKFTLINFFVSFQSAAYPPPGNSYTVLRRLASDPDVGGSYTTIGTPVWNASLNRWVINDVSAVANTFYVYKAISNCGSTEPAAYFAYAYVPCPNVVVYPTDDSISYSFTPPSNATEIKVELYDSSGTVLLDTDTYIPSFATPTAGDFQYLTADTTYIIFLKIKFEGGGYTYTKTCSGGTITTDPA